MKWEIQKPDANEVNELQKALGINPVFCSLLVTRGIKTYEQARNFFNPSLDDLHDPFLMLGMQKAVERILKAFAEKEKILIYGDYDVDGTTSVSLMISCLKYIYPDVDYYIPDRYNEGYGISYNGIDYAVENNFTLMIALDCGIKAVDKIKYANEKSLDVIICDHHLPGDELPPAYSILDPKQPDCNYPFKELPGCGIGFKLLRGLFRQGGFDENIILEFIDLVAVSIACDIVPMIGENRILTYFGLKKINSSPLPAIKALCDKAGTEQEVSVMDLVFIIGPRINAAGRMKDAKEAVHLLIADDTTLDIEEKAGKLHQSNTERKDLDKSTTEEALQMLEDDPENEKRKTTVVYTNHWHKGVIGIVASRLIEKYHRPTIVFTKTGTVYSGSARSVKGFNVYKAILACSDLLEQFGGHKYAAGLAVDEKNIEKFSNKFEEIVSATIDPECLIPKIKIDAEIELDDINDKFMKILKRFAPFGPGNMRPVFLTENVRDTGYAREVGSGHMKSNFVKENSKVFGAILFNQMDKSEMVRNKALDICYAIEENIWNGNVNLQLNVKDLKLHS
jgi:single-stranded-DNA-specific exonuclease